MSLSELSVLVVEDHDFQRRMALRFLAELGVRDLSEAPEGRSALTSLSERDAPVDIVLCDLDMPEMDGIAFIGHVAERKLARGVIIASVLDPAMIGTVESMAREYGLQVLGAVEKPLTAVKLKQLLERYQGVDDAADSGETPSLESIRDGVEQGQFEPWFQPKASMATGQIISVEALARWRRPGGRLLGPKSFLASIEDEGMIDRLTDQMIRQTCHWQRQWSTQGLHLEVAVNLSMLSLSDVSKADHYTSIVRAEGADPRHVMLEITESAVSREAAKALNVLARLRLKGFGLAIDDFGTGYSSLAKLTGSPFNQLKIDQSFVTGAHANYRQRAVVEASLELARKLDLEVVAEGVETAEDWHLLRALGAQQAQGFLISEAVPGAQLPERIRRWQPPRP